MKINRTSLCNIPRNQPLDWIEYFDHNHPSVIGVKKFLDSLNPTSRLLLIGKINALKELASLGRIPLDSRNFEPIALYPELFELKWKATSKVGKRVLIRQYHAEPKVSPRILVALHMHLKNLSGSALEIAQHQNIEISYAKLRLEAGRREKWMI